MPRKIRDLNRDLRKAGFTWRPGKGDHRVWEHSDLERPVVLDGQDGDDAKDYQELDVRDALALLRHARRRQS